MNSVATEGLMCIKLKVRKYLGGGDRSVIWGNTIASGKSSIQQ